MKYFLVVLSSYFLSTWAHADSLAKPSFECNRARSAVEHMICSNSAIAELDSELSQLYKEAIDTTDEDRKSRVINDQRRWIKNHRNNCKTDKCLLSTYNERIDELHTEILYLNKPVQFQ